MTRPQGHTECQFHFRMSPDTRIDRTLRALSEFEVSGTGVHTTIPMHQEILGHPEFRRGDIATDFLERHLAL